MTRAALAVLLLAAGGCGGRQNLLLPPDDAGGAPSSKLGSVDLSQAPSTLPMTCDHGVGTVTFEDPCLVGVNLSGNGGIGIHEVECSLATPPHPVTWAFLLPLLQVAENPDVTLSFPSSVGTSPTSGRLVAVGGRQAGVSSAAGTMTFSRLDTANRAFEARFTGTLTWTDSTGATFTCAADAPLWGAPGSFE